MVGKKVMKEVEELRPLAGSELVGEKKRRRQYIILTDLFLVVGTMLVVLVNIFIKGDICLLCACMIAGMDGIYLVSVRLGVKKKNPAFYKREGDEFDPRYFFTTLMWGGIFGFFAWLLISSIKLEEIPAILDSLSLNIIVKILLRELLEFLVLLQNMFSNMLVALIAGAFGPRYIEAKIKFYLANKLPLPIWATVLLTVLPLHRRIRKKLYKLHLV